MTDQEKQLISGLAERVRNAPAQDVDHDADKLIRTTIGSRPDALYILTQTVLVQEMAINQAKAQIDDLQQRVAAAQQAPEQSGGFLHATPSQGDWGHEGRVQQGAAPVYQQQPQYQQPAYPPPPPQGGGFGSFLRNAATTAAGVVAGEIAFDSLSSLFGHRGGFFGGGGGMFGGGGISPGSETIINNYYGDEHGGAGATDPGSGGDSQFATEARESGQNVSSDIDDERDASGSNFLGDDDDNSGDESDAFDDSSSSDDGGGFDDSGSSDDGGGF
jgi:hypothetical protein